jgi:hypothetical protein
MIKKMTKDQLEKAIRDQEEWISRCGGDLNGYLSRYGFAHDPDHYGDGGEAIHEADYKALKDMEADYEQRFGNNINLGVVVGPTIAGALNILRDRLAELGVFRDKLRDDLGELGDVLDSVENVVEEMENVIDSLSRFV